MRRVLMGLGLATLCLVGLAGYLLVQQARGNVHAVVPGVLYRSGQLAPDAMAGLVKDNGIRSILNLRGASPGDDWYDAEIAMSAEQGLVHADFKMSSRDILGPDRAQALIEMMRHLPTPVLIHCEHGSDRSGLASALYVGAVLGDDEETAERQLSIFYGHFSVPYLSGTYPMDQSFETLEPLLGYGGS